MDYSNILTVIIILLILHIFTQSVIHYANTDI